MLVFFAIQSLALGSQCIVRPAKTVVHAEDLRPGSRISAITWQGYPGRVDPERLANQVRLRDSAGQLVPWTADRLRDRVRFTPDQPFEPGTYTLELRGDYDADGYRVQVGDIGEVSHSAWFPLRSVEVVDAPSVEPAVPRDIEWSRFHGGGTSAGPFSAVVASATVDPKAAWTELEVKGVGAIASGGVADGKTYIRAGTGLCTQGAKRIPLPLAGDLTVRLVVVGHEGERVPGPWEVLGPSTDDDTYPVDPAGPPSGAQASTDGIPTVVPIALEHDTTPTIDIPSSCGRLEPVGLLQGSDFAQGMQLHVDDDGRIRKTWVLSKVIRVDDHEIPLDAPLSLGSRSVALAGRGDAPWLAYIDPAWAGIHIVATKDSTILGRTQVPATADDIQISRFETDGDELLLHWRNPTGSRWRQRFHADLTPVAPVEEVVEPLLFERRGMEVLVNGHRVAGLPEPTFPDAHPVEHEGTVYFTAASKGVGHLVATDLYGNVVWEERYADVGVRSLVVDSFGVHVKLRTLAPGIEARSFSHYGEVIDPMEPPEPAPAVHEPRRPKEERRVVGDRTLVVVRSREAMFGFADASHPPVLTKLPSNRAVVGVVENGAEIAWTDGGQIKRQRYECSGEAFGVPHFWLP